MSERFRSLNKSMILPLLLLISCGHMSGEQRETVPFSCSWYRRSCEDCLSAMRSAGQRNGLLIIDRTQCPPCQEEEQACKPVPAGLKDWPETRDKDEDKIVNEETTEGESQESDKDEIVTGEKTEGESQES